MPLRAHVNNINIFSNYFQFIIMLFHFWLVKLDFERAGRDSIYVMYCRTRTFVVFQIIACILETVKQQNCCVTNVFLNNANFSTFVHRSQLWFKLRYFFWSQWFPYLSRHKVVGRCRVHLYEPRHICSCSGHDACLQSGNMT